MQDHPTQLLGWDEVQLTFRQMYKAGMTYPQAAQADPLVSWRWLQVCDMQVACTCPLAPGFTQTVEICFLIALWAGAHFELNVWFASSFHSLSIPALRLGRPHNGSQMGEFRATS